MNVTFISCSMILFRDAISIQIMQNDFVLTARTCFRLFRIWQCAVLRLRCASLQSHIRVNFQIAQFNPQLVRLSLCDILGFLTLKLWIWADKLMNMLHVKRSVEHVYKNYIRASEIEGTVHWRQPEIYSTYRSWKECETGVTNYMVHLNIPYRSYQ